MITVLADDLSGAAEVAGVFLDRAAPLSLRLNGFGPLAEPGVVIADLNTRSLTPHEAAQAVRSALTDVPAHMRVLKKIDSLLRGNIAAEVAVLAERGPVVVAAALPALGRVPSRHSVAELFPEPLMATGRITICDAETDADLDDVVAAANLIPGAQLVGTSALAAAVARTLPAGHPPEAQPRPSNSVLTVVGTAEPTATSQVEALVAEVPARSPSTPARCCTTRRTPSWSSARSTAAPLSSPSVVWWNPQRAKPSRLRSVSSSPARRRNTGQIWS